MRRFTAPTRSVSQAHLVQVRDTERMIDDTVAIGLRNREVIELARRHCLSMEFTEWAGTGRGIVEATSGLPIGSRLAG